MEVTVGPHSPTVYRISSPTVDLTFIQSSISRPLSISLSFKARFLVPGASERARMRRPSLTVTSVCSRIAVLDRWTGLAGGVQVSISILATPLLLPCLTESSTAVVLPFLEGVAHLHSSHSVLAELNLNYKQTTSYSTREDLFEHLQ